MNILLVQETDWLEKGPLQQNHLMEKMSLRGHRIKVIDYEILWREKNKKDLFSKTLELKNFSRVYEGASIDIVRPGIMQIPNLDYVSLLYTRWIEIKRQINEFKPDVILGFQILSAYLCMLASKKYNIPSIYYWTDVYHAQIPFKGFHFFGKQIESLTLKGSDKVLTINDRLRDYVISIGAKPEKTSVIKGSVDCNKFKPDSDVRIKIRNSFGFTEDDIVLFFVGWLYHFSGLKEVALQLRNADDRLKLLVVGDGDAYQDLINIRDNHNLHKKVTLTGKKPYHEVASLLNAADICLLPAYPHEQIMQEIVPIKFYEYLATARPVISTRLPGVIREFGKDNGVIYIDQPEDAVKKASDIVSNGELSDHGEKARRFAEQNSWDKITDDFETLLNDTIQEKKGNLICF